MSIRLGLLSLGYFLFARVPFVSASALQPSQSVKQIAEIKNPENGGDDQFGYSVAINGNTLVVGAPQYGGGNGFAYVFVKSGATWNQAARITSGNSTSIQFGHAVAIGGDVIAVGTPDDNNSGGVVYIFQKPPGGWQGNLLPSAQISVTDQGLDQFGYSLAVSSDGSVLAAGAPFAAHSAIYVFVEPEGGWVNSMTSNAGMSSPDDDQIGISLAMSGDTVVAGETGTHNLQAAYVFTKPPTGWTGSILPTASLTATDGNVLDHFGESIAISGTTIVVGAPFHRLGNGPGAAYVYVEPRTGWRDSTQTAELNVNENYTALLGDSVAATGNLVLAGAPQNAIGQDANQGSVVGYLKPPSGWKNTSIPTGSGTASDGQAQERFGTSMAISGNTVLVGAPYYGDSLQGAVYIFSLQ